MTKFSKTTKTGMAVALLLASLTTGAQGYGPNGGSSFGRTGRGMTYITGRVLCANCTLAEAHKAQPDAQHLSQFLHEQGRVVLKVHTVMNAPSWPTHWPEQMPVRAAARVFQRLTAEETMAKEVEISGILSNSGALDIFDVAVKG